MMNYALIFVAAAGFAAAWCSACLAVEPADADTFTNPVLETGADPQAFLHDGEYFYVASDTRRLTLWRTPDITDLRHAKRKLIWDAPDGTDHSSGVWAPEIHRIDGKWYVYLAADDGNSDNHKMFVLENGADDPFEGVFELKSRLKGDPNDNWGIDGTVFEHGGSLYYLWSGWATPRVETETACIWIARMENPWTIGSARTMLSQPKHPWERHWQNPPGVAQPARPHGVRQRGAGRA